MRGSTRLRLVAAQHLSESYSCDKSPPVAVDIPSAARRARGYIPNQVAVGPNPVSSIGRAKSTSTPHPHVMPNI